MTDEHLDRMIRNADPYRPDVLKHLDGRAQDLLEEILSVPTLEPVAEPATGKRLRARRGVMSSLAGAGVAAAILAAVLVASAMGGNQREGGQASPNTGSPSGSETQPVYSAMVLKAAEENPRLLIDQPGWKAVTVYGFATKEGTIAFADGKRKLEMNWYPAGEYDGYYKDRLQVSKPEPVTVDGWSGDLFRYSDSDFAAMLRPRDGLFVELRTGGTWTRGDFDRVLGDVIRVDVRTWLAALPAEIVTPGRVQEQAAKVLADVPLPPGFDMAALGDIGVNDPYQFGAELTGRVGCGWIAEWLRAKNAGDDAAVQRAGNALRGSHKWKVLHDINDRGAWPEVFWELADKVAGGSVPSGYEEALGCE